jgi:class 3 adenylate cyclase/tetratricopeptide (TPR) repeat protein
MKCPRCQHENRPGAKFCEECAAPLARACVNCGAQLSATAKFCSDCAHPAGSAAQSTPQRFSAPETYTPKHLAERIINSKAALEGERKQVTVLFADLKGSMELLADRDPEEARKLLDPVIERMMEAVHRYEGTVNQVMGDGIMALFGAPLAHEDHAVRACYAALRMQETVRRYAEGVRRSEGLLVQIRVGLNSGEVVVRSIGSDLHMDYTAVGQTTHLAARMEQIAAPDTIVIAPATLALAEGFVVVKPLGPTHLKGVAEAIEVYELSAASAIHSRLKAAATKGLTRFVGRSAEMARLHEALELAKGGKGQIVAVVGEPGVGKSRLFWEFTHSRETADWLILEGASVSYGKATTYYPVTELLKGYFAIDSRDSERKIREKVTGKVLSLDRALESALPALLSLLDVAPEDERWQQLDPLQRRQRTLEGVKRVLLRESQVQPIIVVFEDLHWIDGETQALLDGLVESLPTARVLLLVNYRPEYPQHWGNRTYYHQVRIDDLPVAKAEELLDSLLGGDSVLRPLKRLLVERTEGNPFFLEETVRALVETAVLVGERGAYRLVGDVQSLTVPATAQAVLAARIDRLAPEDKRRLQAAAVVGKDVPLPLLLAVTAEAEDGLRAGIARLQAAEFLYETRLFPDLEYTFKHALTHEVAYTAILHERRRTLHAHVAEAIERLYRNRLAEQIERLAHHALRGEMWDTAVRTFQEAAIRAEARSAPRQAAAFYEEALGALTHLPRSAELAAREIDLYLGLRGCLFPLGELSRLKDLADKAAALAAAAGDDGRLGRALSSEAHNWWAAGLPQPAVASAESALIAAEERADGSGLIAASFRLGQACHLSGDFRRCVETLRITGERARVELEGTRLDPLRMWSVLSLVWLGFALAELGEFPAAIRAGEEGVRLSEQHETPYGLFHALMGLGNALLAKGEVEQALSVLLRGWTVAEATDLPLMARAVEIFVGYAYLHAGDLENACSTLERGTAYTDSIGFMAFCPFGLNFLSEAYLLAGHVDRAAVLAERAAELTLKYRQRGYHAWSLRMLGEIACHPEHPDETRATNRYRESLTLATELEMRPLQAHCHLGLGKLYRRTDRREQAREHLTTATTMYREMGMTYWLEKAEVELGTL